jgi:hypothetical protein
MFFIQDYRNRHHQRFCSKPDCQAASKRFSQHRWVHKPLNNYFKGPDNIKHVQQWRKAHPGYWKKKPRQSTTALQDVSSQIQPQNPSVNPILAEDALQDVFLRNNPYFLGLISIVTGHTLQDDMDQCLNSVLARGRQFILPHLTERRPSLETEKTIVSKPLATNSRPVQLGGPTPSTG